MSFNNPFRKLSITILFVILLVPSLVLSQNISLTIGDATGRLGEKFVPLDIRISTNSVEIGGYNIWLQLDRPDLIKFQQGPEQLHDTTYWQCNQYDGSNCIDSTLVLSIHSWDFYHVDSSIQIQYQYDKSSYIMPTWFTDTRSLTGMGTDLNIVSLILPGTDPISITPPQENELLIRLYLEVVESLPNLPTDSVVNIILQTQFRDHFSFATPFGNSVGFAPVVVFDSTCYECLQWSDTLCLAWSKVITIAPFDFSICDSIGIVPDTFSVFDSSFWQITNGTFTLLPVCGYASGTYDISNLVALVDFMFAIGEIQTNVQADYNCDCKIDIVDLVGFVNFMFQGGTAPGCATP